MTKPLRTLVPPNPKKEVPALSVWEQIKKQRRHITVANFQNEMNEAHRRANKKLELMQAESLLYGRLQPGMRDRLTYRKAQLEQELAKSMLP